LSDKEGKKDLGGGFGKREQAGMQQKPTSRDSVRKENKGGRGGLALVRDWKKKCKGSVNAGDYGGKLCLIPSPQAIEAKHQSAKKRFTGMVSDCRGGQEMESEQ